VCREARWISRARSTTLSTCWAGQKGEAAEPPYGTSCGHCLTAASALPLFVGCQSHCMPLLPQPPRPTASFKNAGSSTLDLGCTALLGPWRPTPPWPLERPPPALARHRRARVSEGAELSLAWTREPQKLQLIGSRRSSECDAVHAAKRMQCMPIRTIKSLPPSPTLCPFAGQPGYAGWGEIRALINAGAQVGLRPAVRCA